MKLRYLTYAFLPATLMIVLTMFLRSDVLFYIAEVFLVIGVLGMPFMARYINDKYLDDRLKHPRNNF